ncbi:hypothetical protein L1S35_11385 [Flavobacterium sp. AS60]|uniref:hypothetical protein n=1 Tax=Flavobacterium anseongense TaxID=2910677 RepID=UPI001F4310B6|nr:hypothetical protein [Flavobacterium sp. AS60]MCF6130277.1 hypothetical protein [Flavobacterium sp. AS60]
MQKIIFLLVLSLPCLACKNSDENNSEAQTEITFEKEKWKIQEGEDYPYRNSMLNDLVSSGRIKTLTKVEILDLLGKPNRIDNNHFFYMIAQERIQSWPLHTKTLVIKLKDDESVEWVKIHE